MFGQVSDPREVTVRDVISGKAYDTLRVEQSRQMNLKAEIGAAKLRLDSMVTTDPNKAAAVSAWQQAKSLNDQAYDAHRTAVEKYNELARVIRTASLNQLQPKMLSGLGLAPLAIAAVVAGVVLSFGYLAEQVSLAIARVQGLNVETRGLLDQFNDLLRAPGRSIRDVGEGFERFFTGFSKIAWFVTLGAAAYVGYRVYKKRRGGASSAPKMELAPAMPSLKTVEGQVL